jgi:hypothetical protein
MKEKQHIPVNLLNTSQELAKSVSSVISGQAIKPSESKFHY